MVFLGPENQRFSGEPWCFKMLDINLIRENPELVKGSLKKRVKKESLVDEFLMLDRDWRNLKQETDNLRARRNKLSQEINLAKKSRESIDGLIKEAGEIPRHLQVKEKELERIEKKRTELWKIIPNIIDKSVPAGDEEKNKVIKKFGKPSKALKKGHAEIMENWLIDTKKASEVSGSRFYYLKGDLVKLNLAIINFALDFLSKKGFTLIQPPYMLKREVLEGATTLDTFEDAIYKIEGEDLYLIGTAEHALNAFKFNETLEKKELPLRLAGISPCFRKEAGAHGKDTKGIFRVHQFEKVEQFIFSSPEKSWEEFDLILKNSIELYKKLKIPFRLVVLAAGDTSPVSTKTIDLEGYFPSQKAYRELGSCSNCLDYQARRSNTRYQDEGEVKFVHTLNNTAIATERMMTCLVENNMRKNGSIKIPSCLWKYTGFKIIKPEK